MSEQNKDELVKAQNEVIGILFEIVKRLQNNNQLDEEYIQIITTTEKNKINQKRLDKILKERTENETDAEADRYIRKISDDDFFIKALTPIDDFNEYFETDFSDDEFDTIGGLVIQALGHMPARNETTVINNFEFKIINADQRKIHSLRLRPLTH